MGVEHLAVAVGDGLPEAGELMTRAQAIARGEACYRGSPCPRDGTTTRYAVNRGCVACAKARSSRRTAQARAERHERGMAALKRVGLA